MKEHPIIFSTEMVRAILEGRKTQTRRTRRLDEINKDPDNWIRGIKCGDGCQFSNPKTRKTIFIDYPYGKAGDRLWMRETLIIKNGNPKGLPFIGGRYIADNKWRFFGFPYQ